MLPPPDHAAAAADAESLFRTKPIAEIRNVEADAIRQIEAKKEELRQLIGTRYRDLIDSADSILSMKSCSESITRNIGSISGLIESLESGEGADLRVERVGGDERMREMYGIGCRVKYLVDTPENIWGCLDEGMFLEASLRYERARIVNRCLREGNGEIEGEGAGEGWNLRRNFPLLAHQWQIVESFRAQISQRSRERLLSMDKKGVVGTDIGAVADALASVAVIDALEPVVVFGLLLDSRKNWIVQRLNGCGFVRGDDGKIDGVFVVSVLCEVVKIIQVTVAQVGELFLRELNEMPLFYKVVLDSPPASQLFGGIPNPDEEVRLWNEFRGTLESLMVMLDRAYIARSCSQWVKDCGREIMNQVDGKYLMDALSSGRELFLAEKSIRETIDSKDVLEGSLEWLKSVFGSEIELPWSRIRELVLEEDVGIWDDTFEYAFVQRMKVIIDSGFQNLTKSVNVSQAVHAVPGVPDKFANFKAYLNRSSSDGGVWFVDPNAKRASVPSTNTLTEQSDYHSCLNTYFGTEASRIRDAVDSYCRDVLDDFLCFLESPKASLRLRNLAPYLQTKCYECLSTIVMDLKKVLEQLRHSLHSVENENLQPYTIVERSLFIGRLLFAFEKHSKHIPILLRSPRLWVSSTTLSVLEKLPVVRHSRLSSEYPSSDGPVNQTLTSPRRQTSLAAAALFGSDDSTSSNLENITKSVRDLCITAHDLWISWISNELAKMFSEDLRKDDGLATMTSLRGWEEIPINQEQSGEGGSEIKISLPSMPSLYVSSFLFRACQEINRIGGHVLDKTILQQLALRLLEKVIVIYDDLNQNSGSQISEKGALQVMLDLRFAADNLSGGDPNVSDWLSKNPTKYPFRRKQDKERTKSVIRDRIDNLVKQFAQRLDPIDWQTYEPYLWENESQCYLRHAVLFGFFVQLNRMYTDKAQKTRSNTESNVMRCSSVPRFKYLPISAPALSSRGMTKAPFRTSSDDISSRSKWKAQTSRDLSQGIDFNDSSSFGVAAPFFKSFMQVGSKFGENTFIGSILGDNQVGKIKDRSAAMMSTFGDIVPIQAAGLLSSLTGSDS
ncbi:hypothetical protein Droror1_Dr00001679 [Drosera rotundifolia]